MVCVMVGWVFFSAPSICEAFAYIGAMFGRASSFADSFGSFLLSTNFALLIIGGVSALPVYKAMTSRMKSKNRSRLILAATPLLFVLCIIFMISETYNPFLYFRF